MRLEQLYRFIMAAMLVTMLSACGGEGNDTPEPPKPIPNDKTLLALDGLVATRVNQEKFVDLSPFVWNESDNATIEVENATPDRCEPPTVNGLGFDTSIRESGWCDYSYTVYDQQGNNASGVISLVSSVVEDPTLRPISVATGAGEVVEINLDNHVSGLDLTEYELRIFKVQTPHGMPAGELTNIDKVLTYTAPSVFGWNFVQYALTKTDDVNDTRLGYIYITISDLVNTPPIINKPEWYYPEFIRPSVDPITINLSDLKDKGGEGQGLTITDNEGHDWQLLSVNAMGAQVESSDPQDVFNKSFDFTAPQEGAYDIAYIVGDHYGGFSHGMMRINVDEEDVGEGDVTNPHWSDITWQGKGSFSAPLLFKEVQLLPNISELSQYKEIIDLPNQDVENYNVALWTENSAKEYCESIGRSLPRNENYNGYSMNDLNYSGEKAVEALRNKWPDDVAYITKNTRQGNDFVPVKLNTSQVTDVPVDVYGKKYVTCFSRFNAWDELPVNGVERIKVEGFTGRPDIIAKVISKNGILKCDPVHAEVVHSNNPEEIICKSRGNSNYTTFNYSPSGEGLHRITFTNGDIPNLNVTFETVIKGNRQVLHSGSLLTDKDDYVLEKKQPTSIRISQQDENGNPVEGFSVRMLDKSNNSSWNLTKSGYISTITNLQSLDFPNESEATILVTADEIGSADLLVESMSSLEVESKVIELDVLNE